MRPTADSARRQSTSNGGSDITKENMTVKMTELISTSGYSNEGTAMDNKKRNALHLNGLLPYRVETMDNQKDRVMHVLHSKDSMLEKYILMAQLRTSNVRLFYKVVMEELEELAPIIYTPTVGTACLEYSNIYPFLSAPGVSDGLYLTKASESELCDTIRNYNPPYNSHEEPYSPQIAVISDGSRILGLGDLGVNGMGIPIGKLQLYVAAAGIDPRKTLPILLDLGTDNEKYQNDPFFLGVKEKRPDDNVFYKTVDTVINAIHKVYPDILIQFEDWSTEHAFGLLKKHRDEMLCFNDDIQGTGAVILSGVMNAIKNVEEEDGVKPRDHRLLFHGAGSATIGVARQIQEYFHRELEMPEEEAKKLFWIVDSKGLVTSTRGDKLSDHKLYYARDDTDNKQYKELLDIVNYVKPTILIGLSSQSGVFTHDILARLAELNKQPIVFPLSNPATQSECTFEQAMKATNETVIFASGTAFPPYHSEKTGAIKHPGQGNNMYIFPGLGLGAVLAKPKRINDNMIYAASKALANALTKEEIEHGWVYPSLKRIRAISAIVAAAVCQASNKENLTSSDGVGKLTSEEEILDYVKEKMWSPTKESYGVLE